jgi:hypothetical protein
MAPLVSEIDKDGNEIQNSNPTRIRLFRDFQSLLLLLIAPDNNNNNNNNSNWYILLEQVAQTLLVALKLATRIDGTAKHAKSKNYDLDPAAAYHLFVYCRSTPVQSAAADAGATAAAGAGAAGAAACAAGDAHVSLSRGSLELIKALIKRHPESSCTFTTLLLIGDRATSYSEQSAFQSCRTCAYGNHNNGTTTTMFLEMLHEPVGRLPCGDLLRLAVDIVKAILENAPLPIWLQRDEKTPRHCGGGRDGQQFIVKTTASGFRERLSQGLQNLIEITKCRMITTVGMSNNDNKTILHGCALAGCIFRVVPFNGRGSNEAVRLQKSGCDLVQATVDLCTTHSMQEVRQAATEALLEGMGGRVNPQGELTSMSFPIKEWLSGRQGCVFVAETTEAILRNVGTRDQNSGVKAQLVRAMLRTYPGLFFKTKCGWEYMRTCSESSNAQARLEGALALQSLMNGRKDFGGCTDNVDTALDSSGPITEFVVPLLLAMLNDRGNDGASIRCALLAAYGAMLPNDWRTLAASRLRMDHVHINLILDIAQESQTSDKVRSEACKAIGDICTSYFSEPEERVMGMLWDDSHSKNICENVCQTLLAMLDSSHSCSVRACVVLAMGNLVHALRDPFTPMQCPSTISLLPACILAELAKDEDAKISGNAIRTLGHVTCLLFREDYTVSLASLGFDRKWLLRSTIQTLTSRLQSVILLARGELRSLNWKERSVIKKHAWGSCNSLASIFGAGIVLSVRNDNDDENSEEEESIRECLSCLLQCVEESHKVHEKVVISSMVALCSMNIATLSHHCGKNQLSLTKAIAVCMMLVYKRHIHDGNDKDDDDDDDTHLLSAKVTEKAALLLEHLLRCCSIPNAADVLRSESVSTPMIDYLYQWMLEKECPTSIFDTFALAMQKANVQVDVQTEQRFSSRAMSLLRQNNQDDEL